MKSQTLPEISAASAVGPATVCASAKVGKVSILQNSGPCGSSFSLFSTNLLLLGESLGLSLDR